MIWDNSLVRSLLFPLLSKLDFVIRWKHDLTEKDFFLRSWKHKGYWFKGKDREAGSVEMLRQMIRPGDVVVEVGAHIGYLTQIFEKLCGAGQVIAVEPAPENLRLLKKNVGLSTIVVPFALGERNGSGTLFVDGFGGFTNSLSKEFAEKQTANLMDSQHVNGVITKIEVEVRTLDELCAQNDIVPDFIKIDTEGSELEVLRGGTVSLSQTRGLMIEISGNKKEIFSFLKQRGLKCFDGCSEEDLVDRGEVENFFFSRVGTTS